MAAFGIARRIDALGRVVLPADLRRTLHLSTGDELVISVENDAIVLRKAGTDCVFCGADETPFEHQAKRVCRPCAETLSAVL